MSALSIVGRPVLGAGPARPCAAVYDLFVPICPTVFPVTLADTDRAMALLGAAQGVGVRDAVHAAVMLNNNVTRIATFDAGFDAIAVIERLEIS